MVFEDEFFISEDFSSEIFRGFPKKFRFKRKIKDFQQNHSWTKSSVRTWKSSPTMSKDSNRRTQVKQVLIEVPSKEEFYAYCESSGNRFDHMASV